MAKTKKEKDELIAAYEERIENSKAVVVISPTAITPNEATTLRKKLSELDSSFSVVKNSLFKLAVENKDSELKNIDYSGENAIVFIKEQTSEGTKAVYEFLKSIKKGEIKGGVLDQQALSKEEVESLAELPSRDVMIATTVRTISAPLNGFVNVLNANIVNFVNVLKNISEKN